MTLEAAETLALELIKEHGLEWTFTFDRAKRRFGCCNYTTQTISLSRSLTLLNDKAEVRDTLLHEIAHALTPGTGHGAAWRKKCLEIGAKPERCYSGVQVAQPEPNFFLECPSCQQRVPRMRRSRRALYCRSCCKEHAAGRAAEAFKMRWRRA